MSRTPGTRRALLAAVVLTLLVTACSPTSTTAALGDADPDYAPGWNGVAVEGTPAMPEAEFVGEDGEPFDLADEMRERPTLLYFGYTHCPDICPVHMVNIAQALDKSRVRTDEINVVFVTADPARDTPSVLSDYMENFDTTFDGLWAPQHVVNDVVTDLGLPEPVIERDPETDADNYTVGHPGQVLAFDTDGRAQISYPFGTRQSQWAEDLPKIVREDWS